MGKVDDLRAMREARYAAATRTLKVAGAPARAPAPVSMPAADLASPSPAKPAKRSPLRVVTEPGPTQTVELPEPAGTEPAALFAVAGGADDSTAEPEPAEDLCGHRAISGKTCIRENKHAEKNHKYAKS